MIDRFVLETLSERQKDTKSYLISVYWRSVLLTGFVGSTKEIKILNVTQQKWKWVSEIQCKFKFHKFHPFHKFNVAILILISTSRIIPTYHHHRNKRHLYQLFCTSCNCVNWCCKIHGCHSTYQLKYIHD